MKYSTVEIKPQGYKRDTWEVSFYDLDGDRVEESPGPHSLGFYHYPRKLGKEKAFNKLKSLLISKHSAEIERLTKSLKKLKELRLQQ